MSHGYRIVVTFNEKDRAALFAIRDRCGIPITEQIRRAVGMWLTPVVELQERELTALTAELEALQARVHRSIT
jgi:hypothetical protein